MLDNLAKRVYICGNPCRKEVIDLENKIRPTFTVDPQVLKEARAVSKQKHISLSGIVEDALKLFIAAHTPPPSPKPKKPH